MKRLACLLLGLCVGLTGSAAAEEAVTRPAVTYLTVGTGGGDEAYIVADSSQASANQRWCDLDRRIVWCFDLTAWQDPVFRLQISQNYRLAVSPDGEGYTVVADYGAETGRRFDGSVFNTRFVTVDPAAAGCTDKLYIRLSNCYPDGGWGGAVQGIAVLYRQAAEPLSPPLYGDVDGNGDVNAADALQALQHSVKLLTLDGEALAAADVDGNGSVNAADALLMLQQSVKLMEWTPAEAARRAVVRPGSRLLFVGDSVTDAARDHGDPDDLGTGYVQQIAALTDTVAPGMNTVVLNRGLNGTRTHDWLPLIGPTLDEAEADVVTVALGVNDCWRRYDSQMPTTAEDYGDNLRLILTAAAQTGAKLVVMAPFVIPGSAVDVTGWMEEDLADKIAVCRQVAAEFGAVYIPLDEIFAGQYENDTLYTVDGVHPSSAGATAIAMAWLEAVPFAPVQ